MIEDKTSCEKLQDFFFFCKFNKEHSMVKLHKDEKMLSLKIYIYNHIGLKLIKCL